MYLLVKPACKLVMGFYISPTWNDVFDIGHQLADLFFLMKHKRKLQTKNK